MIQLRDSGLAIYCMIIKMIQINKYGPSDTAVILTVLERP